MKVLVAEDDATSAAILEKIFTKRGYTVTVKSDGAQAYEALQAGTFDALVTDWMMPHLDGIELIRKARATMTKVPPILVVTALAMPTAREHALDSGADAFMTKPFFPHEVLEAFDNCLARYNQTATEGDLSETPVVEPPSKAPFVAVGLTASTGGPAVLTKVFKDLPVRPEIAYFVVLQAPVWALEVFSMRLQKQTNMKVLVAEDGMPLQGGRVYIAPHDRHMTIETLTHCVRLEDTPPRNFCRPSADTLFEALASTCGKYSVAVALTGIGRDGAIGSARIAAAGGSVVVQDPASCDAPNLVQSVMELPISVKAVHAEMLGNTLADIVNKLSESLKGGTMVMQTKTPTLPTW